MEQSQSDPSQHQSSDEAGFNFLTPITNTQAFRDRHERVNQAKEELAASKGVSVEDLSPEDIVHIIMRTPVQADMVMDEIFGAGFMDSLDETGGLDDVDY